MRNGMTTLCTRNASVEEGGGLGFHVQKKTQQNVTHAVGSMRSGDRQDENRTTLTSTLARIKRRACERRRKQQRRARERGQLLHTYFNKTDLKNKKSR